MPNFRETPRRWDISTAALVLANATPVFGVLFLHWQVFPLLLLYWCENVIVGLINVLRMALAGPVDQLVGDEARPATRRTYLIPGRHRDRPHALRVLEGWMLKVGTLLFFCCHWGAFTLGHGTLLFQLFGGKVLRLLDVIPSALTVIQREGLGFAALSMAASHAVSFVVNYVHNGEYRRASLEQLLFQPYRRLFIMHATLLGGGFLMWSLGSAVYGMLVLVAIKTGVDVAAHRAERRQLGSSSPSAQAEARPAKLA